MGYGGSGIRVENIFAALDQVEPNSGAQPAQSDRLGDEGRQLSYGSHSVANYVGDHALAPPTVHNSAEQIGQQVGTLLGSCAGIAGGIYFVNRGLSVPGVREELLLYSGASRAALAYPGGAIVGGGLGGIAGRCIGGWLGKLVDQQREGLSHHER